jgi:TfoX/Sxy family transcriptional regulator of competence genes
MAKRRKVNSVRKWGSAPDAWLEVFGEVSAGLGEHRLMFGYPCAFVNGNMFAGLFQSGMFLRLSESGRVAFLKLKGASRFEPMRGRFMREYVVAPSGMARQPDVAAGWLRRAYEYGSSLPVKAARTPKRRRLTARRGNNEGPGLVSSSKPERRMMRLKKHRR